MSRRYLGLPGREELLRHNAELGGEPYEYYAATADGDLPRVASLIAADLHERWWTDAAFEESRRLYRATTSQSALKIEISRQLANSSRALPTSGPLAKEVEKLRAATIDGVITTNYDRLLEDIFPDFEVFVSQDQMLFAHAQGVGEIYTIHGSYEDPHSLVLTAEDYARFKERNPYVAGTLLTVFVEHPVVFLGYRLGDPNVTQVLQSIASVLTNDRIGELQGRLIFVEWNADVTNPKLDRIPFLTDSYNLSMLRAEVAEYSVLYDVLARIRRRFPAPVLRQVKQRIYELVQTNDPNGRLHVQDLEPDADPAEIDVVLGVGAIARQLERAYRGLNRDDLSEDVVTRGSELDPRRVVADVAPGIARNVHVPIFKYLRACRLLEDDGTLTDAASVDERVADRVATVRDRLRVPTGYEKRAAAAAEEAGDFNTLMNQARPRDVLIAAPLLPAERQNPEALRQFLLSHREPDGDQMFYLGLWHRGVCLYDWLHYGLRI
jgi:hypothetical protein